jgi:hypothetical protein
MNEHRFIITFHFFIYTIFLATAVFWPGSHISRCYLNNYAVICGDDCARVIIYTLHDVQFIHVRILYAGMRTKKVYNYTSGAKSDIITNQMSAIGNVVTSRNNNEI